MEEGVMDYVPVQFDAAVSYITEHNEHFKDKPRSHVEDLLRKLIKDGIENDAKWVRSGGFFVVFNMDDEDITPNIAIYVDPAPKSVNREEWR